MVATSVPGFPEGVYKCAFKIYFCPVIRPVTVCVTVDCPPPVVTLIPPLEKTVVSLAKAIDPLTTVAAQLSVLTLKSPFLTKLLPPP